MALTIELSSSYLTPLCGQWLVHGSSCWVRKVSGLYLRSESQLRIGADKCDPLVQLKQSIAMVSEGVDTMWFLPSALHEEVMKFKQTRVNGMI